MWSILFFDILSSDPMNIPEGHDSSFYISKDSVEILCGGKRHESTDNVNGIFSYPRL